MKLAKARGISVALGVWVEPGKTAENHAAIKEAMSQAQQYGNVVHVVVGNEVNRQDVFKFTPQEVTDLLNWAKALPNRPPVTSCFSGTVLQPGSPIDWTAAVQACEQVVYLTEPFAKLLNS